MERLRNEIDSLPRELGTLERQIRQPGIESEALKSEEEKEKLAAREE